MSSGLLAAREHFIQGISRVSHFWGFPKAMGAIYGAIYLSPSPGDRKDYYIAETDFWKILKDILREREKYEFDHALRTIGESLEMVKKTNAKPSQLGDFYKERIQGMKKFFDSLDNLVATIIALDELRSGTIKKLFGKPVNK
jgi:DNA-binding transcriptional regulator GbsR (MarR family)